jgi:hypothetical protein
MEIIFGRENATKLREKYTVLDLETVDANGQPLEVFCLIPADKIGLGDLPTLAQWTKLHEDFIAGLAKNEYDYCRQCIEHLTGKFGGEVDSFYQEILRRIDTSDLPVNL